MILSILTSCRDRAGLLERVFASLVAQGARDIEWIVGDDGSSDGSAEVVRRLAAGAPFPVTLVGAAAHVGKARIDNAMVAAARGTLALFLDSDDWLAREAVARIRAAWRPGLAGVVGLADSEGRVIVDPLRAGEERAAFTDLTRRMSGPSDMALAWDTARLRAHPFPEVDLLIPESAVWSRLGRADSALVPHVLIHKQYGAPNAVSFVPTMKYHRGRAVAAAMERAPHAPATWRELTAYQRWSLHGEIGLVEAARRFGGGWRYWAALPFGLALALRDRLTPGKVVATHRTFEANRAVPIVTQRLREAG